jgi:hypothetical protein
VNSWTNFVSRKPDAAASLHREIRRRLFGRHPQELTLRPDILIVSLFVAGGLCLSVSPKIRWHSKAIRISIKVILIITRVLSRESCDLELLINCSFGIQRTFAAHCTPPEVVFARRFGGFLGASDFEAEGDLHGKELLRQSHNDSLLVFATCS